jgi:hypothetical protein
VCEIVLVIAKQLNMPVEDRVLSPSEPQRRASARRQLQQYQGSSNRGIDWHQQCSNENHLLLIPMPQVHYKTEEILNCFESFTTSVTQVNASVCIASSFT